jgi:UDP-3-O-acyl-N-acetylglucosamine deacetylase
MGIAACRVETDAPELPLLDGSAAGWVDAITRAGVVHLPTQHDASPWGAVLRKPLYVEEPGSWLVAIPTDTPRLTVGIDFPSHAPIGRQWATWTPADGSIVSCDRDHCDTANDFAVQVAPARTFTTHDQIEGLRAAGLIKGGSLDNALVCNAVHWLNGPLRFTNEPARHKLLDLLGDLALLGKLPHAHVVAFRASHRLHVRLAQAIERQDDLEIEAS